MAQYQMQANFYEDPDEGQLVNIKHCEILWGSFRNFGGVKTAYTQEGDRYFNIRLPEAYQQMFAEQGLNVKFFKATGDDEDGGEKDGFVKVKLNYGFWRKPIVNIREGYDGNWVELQEESLAQLDKTEFDDVGLILKVHRGQMPGGRPYTTLYLRTAFLTKHANEPSAYVADMYSEYGYTANSGLKSVTDEEEMPF